MDTVDARSNLVSTSFMTDISNFDDFDSSRSFLSGKDPLTSTPTKLSNDNSEAPTLSPLHPPFMLVDEPSIELSLTTAEQSVLESNHSDMSKDSTSNSRPGQS